MGGNSRCGIFRPAGDGSAVTGQGCSNDWQGTMLESATALRRSVLACASAVALLGAGCTMCPDPYDYSGPVPNGSAPQNDFHARSNGILPTGATPRPFPPIVKAEPQPASEAPAATEPIPEEPEVAAAEDDVLRLSAEEPADPEQESPDVQPTSNDATENTATENDAAPAAEPQPETDAWRERTGGPDPAPAVATEPVLQETPGWRSRR